MNGLQQAAAALREEFSDIGDAAALTRVLTRLTLAAVLGGLLGWERESKAKAAGVRTHMLVAIGSALFVLVPRELDVSAADVARVLQGLVAGIGFLGAGAIVKGSGEDVKGLTTAAGIWLTAAIGMAVGLGREMTAVLSTGMALAVLTVTPRILGWVEPKREVPAGKDQVKV
ncbi:MAG: MgtC/SapB family protein [Gemmataceae bacterium]